ncbi:hypothetical protein B0H19DRAFT_1098561 [Mycena capillaripes]|nr:hypothetical protein B0H19DRAFT_1098561 [Mycena capillaripes]
MVSRHLEVLVSASPREARKLIDDSVLSATKFLAAAKQLFLAILDVFRRGVMHRDISVNNILLADSQLLMIDWEIGRRFVEPFNRQDAVIGTLDTMSVASLMRADPLPHDDIESASYVLLKVITQRFKPQKDKESEWKKLLAKYKWDHPYVDLDLLQQSRMVSWYHKSSFPAATPTGATVKFFRSCGHTTTAKLLELLFFLPLPIDRDAVNMSDHAAVLSSLEDLVKRAVAIVDSVDASVFASEMGFSGEG